MSAANNLEAITEENAKDEPHEPGKHEEEDTDSKSEAKGSNSATEMDKNLDILHDGSLVEEKAEEVMKGDEDVTSPQSDENEVTQDSVTMEEPPSQPEVSQTIIDMDGMPSSSGYLEQHQETLSTSSSSDDDADAALSNLEGFTPLVDLKFKK